MHNLVSKWTDLHPVIRRAVKLLRSEGYRVTSIVRPGPIAHERGLAADIAPMMYDDDWASLNAAKLMYSKLKRILPPLMVVGEDDHIHIEVSKTPGYGYDGVHGRVFPSTSL